MKATVNPSPNKQNEIYTYIAIPIEALQQSTDQGKQTVTVPQNVIFKALAEGSQKMQSITAPENVIVRTVSWKNKKNPTQAPSNIQASSTKTEMESKTIQNVVRPTVIEHNGQNANSFVRRSVILKSLTKKCDGNANARKPEVRNLNCKSAQINNVKTKIRRNPNCLCVFCGESFVKRTAFRKHMEMHRNMKKYKCEQCNASYNVEDNLKLHMVTHSKSEPKCPICQRKFQRLASLKAHLIIHQVEEVFTCVECLAEYEKEDDLMKHMENHKKPKKDENPDQIPLVCSYCSYTFQDSTEYKKHISIHLKIKRFVMKGKRTKRRTNTNKEQLFKCNVCKKSFPKLCLLERHLRIHSGEKPFVCHFCSRAFSQKGTLQIHLSLHTGYKPFQCLLCSARFCQKGNLRVHVQKTHMAPAPGEKAYKCSMCTCVFKKVSSLNAHITRAHSDEKEGDDIAGLVEQLKELENQTEPNKSSISSNNNNDEQQENQAVTKENNHRVEKGVVKFVKLVDSSIEGTMRRYWVKQRKMTDHTYYICSYCSKEFKKPSDLIRHIRVHTREKPFKCKQCDQAFSLKSTLIGHIATHIGKRECQCLICNKTFTSVRTLNAHLRKHEKRNTQEYMCNTCNAVFSTMTKAKLHMELHKADSVNKRLDKLGQPPIVLKQPLVETATGMLPLVAPKSQCQTCPADSGKIRPFKCHLCGAAFTKKVHQKRHLLIHSGEKKFKCDICSKSFFFSYALREHLKFHNGERNYMCKICGKGFVTNAILKRHVMIHSSSKPYICPYCCKRFKTTILCRKHIGIHKRNLNLEIHALNETGELGNIADLNTIPTAELNETLTDSPFSNALIDTSCNLGLSLENLENNSDFLTEETNLNKNSAPSTSRLKAPENNNSVSTILYSDINGIVISTDTENPLQDKDNNLQNLFNNNNNSSSNNNQQLYQASTISQNFIDKSMNFTLMSDSGIINDLGNVEDLINFPQEDLTDENGYATLFINLDDLQTFTSTNLYNTCFTQLKENNDPLLMDDLNELQDPNILFSTDPSLNSISDLQLDPQTLEMLMPLALGSNLTLNNLSVSTNSLNGLNASLPNLVLPNIDENNDINQIAALPSISEITKKPGIHLNNINATISGGKLCDQQNYIQTLDGSHDNIISLSDDPIMDPEEIILSNLLCSTNHLDIISNESNNNNIGMESIEDTLIANGLNIPNIDVTCSACKEIFKAVNDLKQHDCTTHNDDITNKENTSHIIEQNEHVKSSVNNNLKNDGVSKPKQQTNKRKTTGNMASKPAEKKHKCSSCDKIFVTKNALARHVLTHNEENVATLNSCSYCGKLFKKPSDLKRHVRTHTGEKPYSCDKCEKSFTLKSTLDCHYRTHNPGGNKDFSCSICNACFSSKSSLRIHTSMHTGEKPYQCTMCPEKFRTSGNRRSHMANHLKNTDMEKNPQSKNAKVNNILASVIMDSHTEENNLENESLVTVNNMQPSIESSKENSEIIMQGSDRDTLSLNQSIQVDPLFLQELQLNNILLQDNTEDLSFVQVGINNDIEMAQMKSLLTNNGNDINNFDESLYGEMDLEKNKSQSSLCFTKSPPTVTTKDFKCDICHKNYASKRSLTKHKKRHTIFKCIKCNHTFKSEDELNNHLRLHEGYRLFCCQLCINTFNEEKHLKTHMKRIHDVS